MASGPPEAGRPTRARLDVWLWRARFLKTRSLAAEFAKAGHVRINGQRATTAAQPLRVGDTLTMAFVRDVRVVRVVALGGRRGPATEARGLYDDLMEGEETPKP
ncbi:RNA-binding S4 domain-containing protein [Hansschlegelia quercus]|uniref:RNA-binding S4 domain-containing protein n=1 Tax=Hansschlegelia quercus TaxID=2528245 RepID=A0A4Q9GQJ0_9HYPH|nr:RNA-binding S4 domain-containing protein [Hansschlegelia quercus]TBN53947.1 RNA-binding S4 domain-containing protein [Hansschlegelia quercus]